jgi:hypothetical protein
MAELVSVSPQHRWPEEDGILIRVTVADTDKHAAEWDSTEYPVTWEEARRLNANLTSIIQGRMATLEKELLDE